jgi:hypothetical protein
MSGTEIPHAKLGQRLGARVVEIATEFQSEIAALFDPENEFSGVERHHDFNLSDGRRLRVSLSADFIDDLDGGGE